MTSPPSPLSIVSHRCREALAELLVDRRGTRNLRFRAVLDMLQSQSSVEVDPLKLGEALRQCAQDDLIRYNERRQVIDVL